MIDVDSEVLIRRPAAQVAAYAMDPAHETSWIGGLISAQIITPGPFDLGTRVAREAKFLGRRMSYVLEVAQYSPGTLLDMKSVTAPFPMRVTYAFLQVNHADTAASIRILGWPPLPLDLISPLLTIAVQRNITADLLRLKRIVEAMEPASLAG